ncbi:MAG: outer membrane protein assembly factor BamB family protein [Planctomycetota bacterium]
MMMRRESLYLLCVAFLSGSALSSAHEWPMWRCDAGRNAISAQKLPDELHLQWVRRYPRVKPAFETRRLQFDAGYEPVVMAKTLFFGSPSNDTVSAIDTETGVEKWKFYTDGPVRFAPVVWKDRVFAASDDGCLYCLNAATGKLMWRFCAVPSNRRIIGNGRLVSVWPVRGGPVLEDGRIYFAAGIWPFEGIFVYALDAETGKVIWLNDRSGSLYLGHPHGAWSFGGPSLQGYLLVNGKDLLVPNGTGGVPAYFDIETGKLLAFCHLANRIPGSWFVVSDPNGQLYVDPDYNRELHEDRPYETHWSNTGPWVSSQRIDPWVTRKWLAREGTRNAITAGGRKYRFDEGFEGVEGKVCSMIAADEKMFVVTDAGCIYCFGDKATTPKNYNSGRESLQTMQDSWIAKVKQILSVTGRHSGYALVLGIGTGRLIEEIAIQTDMHIIAVDADAEKVDALRRRLDSAGLYGRRVAIHAADPIEFVFPPYLADLILSEDLSMAGFSRGTIFVKKMFQTLRPYGGVACLSIPSSRRAALSKWVRQANLKNAKVRQVDAFTVIMREGALPGTSNYAGKWISPDELVKAPLGVLWYDDSVRQFKRSPQPKIIDGVMISQPKAWLTTQRPYSLEAPTFADVYTGRMMSKEEVVASIKTLPDEDNGPQPPQYRPPDVDEDNIWGERICPVTGLTEPRLLPKSYGCEPGVDYGYMITMRSGTGAFYDKWFESGLVNITGIRSGCTNSIIPANGVLNVPYFYEGCTCGYPLASGLGMINMPEEFEQWMAWGETPFQGRIKRLGINFGAPGDRMTESGTLWLDYPSVGGPSPEIAMAVASENATYYYRHSLWIKGGGGVPWVTASGVEGAESISVGLIPEQYDRADANDVWPYTIRLYFAEPDNVGPGDRVFSVSLQGKEVLRDFDIVKTSGDRMRGIVKEFKRIRVGRTLELNFSTGSGKPIISGIELILDM